MFADDTLLLDTRKAISAMLSMTEVDSHGKYLGLPTTISASKKEVFRSIVDRVKAKVDNWKPRLLSTAGKEIFIISVLQSILMFTMQCFKLAVQVCNDGGLGYTQQFNQALLCKQTWKLITKPCSQLS
ncbi:hypothetical protein LIER_33154 [Lithospermum erythrorhizon]|uniref:Reverse transcriptase n=1 Tax=Lithospermum erythrorhizon TaxID=34254 RepID=A0AAV3S160_LITER